MPKNPLMGRCGIGPKFGTIMITYALAGAYLTHRRPEMFGIPLVSRTFTTIAGAILLTWGTITYVRALLVLNQALREGKLAVIGPFAHVRHPIYASWILLLIPGSALMLHSWLVLSAALVGYVSFRILIQKEEAALEEKHGEEYSRYAPKHNRLLPRLSRKEKL